MSIAFVEEFLNLRKELKSSTRDVSPFPDYAIKKNSRGAKHGPSERQRMHYKVTEILQKARQPKHGGHPSILAPWHKDDEYRNSLSQIGWTEEYIMLHDRIALEDHSYVATRAERIQNSAHWILKLNRDGAQPPLNQRPDFCSSEKRTQETARRKYGKDSTKL